MHVSVHDGVCVSGILKEQWLTRPLGCALMNKIARQRAIHAGNAKELTLYEPCLPVFNAGSAPSHFRRQAVYSGTSSP